MRRALLPCASLDAALCITRQDASSVNQALCVEGSDTCCDAVCDVALCQSKRQSVDVSVSPGSCEAWENGPPVDPESGATSIIVCVCVCVCVHVCCVCVCIVRVCICVCVHVRVPVRVCECVCVRVCCVCVCVTSGLTWKKHVDGNMDDTHDNERCATSLKVKRCSLTVYSAPVHQQAQGRNPWRTQCETGLT